MKLKSVVVLIEAAFLICWFQVTDSNETNFVPTNEWQELAEDQPIPAGLHVRINLSTGKKEAKLLDTAQNPLDAESSLSLVPGQEVKDHGVDRPMEPMDPEALKERLRNIPANVFDREDEHTNGGPHKSYDQIKQELKEANMELKTDSEIMTTLFARFEELLPRTSERHQELDTVFEDLRYLAHQIDNALEFIDRGGLENIIWPSLNRTTETSIRIQALVLLGTLTQNNPKAKVSLFERDGSAKLLAAFGRATSSDEISAALYAFGSLVRKFPFAQKQLLTAHGYSLLRGVLEKPVELKVKVKVLQLIADLLEDYRSVTGRGETDQVTAEQYRSTQLLEGLEKTEFCKHAEEFFHWHRSTLLAEENLIDEAIKAMRSSMVPCQQNWSEDPRLRHTLLVIRNTLDNRLTDVSDLVEYRTEIRRNIDEFVLDLYGPPKDEL
ncbi:nucleotide exchange factor Sil1 [Anopheles bellator]|uniref:nucleotide exchange factor Sil1 n=1 Tax=Anopheles bellator TaxID=139047 RepID=UPI0026494F60|nr:nucleotide exchange factor Sil1 [Anopheles bellator]